MDQLTKQFLVDSSLFDGTVLVTGASGCIGAWTLAILSRSGIDCVGADLSEDRRRPALILGEQEAGNMEWARCDVTDSNSVQSVVDKHNVQAIVHLAGLQIPFCAANPAMGARVNVEGTINILEAARNAGIKRTVYASSVAARAFPQGGDHDGQNHSMWKETLYGAYKVANEQTANVYWNDWQVPSVGLRPNVVYGIARDQGMSSKNTIAIQAAAMNESYEVPFAGGLSWLYAGEAAAAFIASVSQDGNGAFVFDLNGTCETVENGLAMLEQLAPHAKLSCTGKPFPFPADMDDGPLRAHVPDYPSVSVKEGIKHTYDAFIELQKEGKLAPLPVG